jgi:hypothetical protein
VIDVPKSEARPFEQPPLSWRPFPGFRRYPGQDVPEVIVKCPNGHSMMLGDQPGAVPRFFPTIDEDGVVSTVRCSWLGCDFEDSIRLVGWP